MHKDSALKAASAVVAGAAITAVGVFLWVDALNTFTNPAKNPGYGWIFEGIAVSAVWCVGLVLMFVGADRIIQRRNAK